jgi:GNAT superfamily N-acetyltransferase
VSLDQFLPLIASYQRFYGVEPDEARNAAYFSALVDSPERGIMYGAFDAAGYAVGFATLYFVPSSLSAATTCTFNDLYTVPDVRGDGVGVALGLHCLMQARSLGYEKVSWLTSPDNKVARQIYQYTNAKCSDWCSYELTIGGAPERPTHVRA